MRLPHRSLTLYFGAACLEAAVCLIWLLLIPTEGSYSAARLALAGGLLLVGLISAALWVWAVRARSLPAVVLPWPAYPLLVLAAGLAVAGLVLVVLPSATFGDWKYGVDRLKPLLVWATLVGLQTALLLATGLAQLVSTAMGLLLLAGALLNLWLGPQAAAEANARLLLLPGDSAVIAGETYHYSLSVYHILAVNFAGRTLKTAPGLAQEWNLTAERLAGWAHIQMVESQAYAPELTPDEVDVLLAQQFTDVEINTVLGSYHYYFLPAASPPQDDLIMAWNERKRFFIPQETYQRTFPERPVP